MINTEAYHMGNGITVDGARKCLKDFGDKFRWKKGDKIADIGSADGAVTQVLKEFLPRDYQELIGCDIKEEMVRFATEKYGDERTKFTLCDIEGILPEQLKGRFDHVFSFYTFHWVQNQERGFRNIYDLISEDGGDCLVMQISHHPCFDVYRKLAEQPKWRARMIDIEKFMPPYQDAKDPVKEVKNILNQVGFSNVEVKRQSYNFLHEDIELYKQLMLGVCPYQFSADVSKQYIEDYMRVISETHSEKDDLYIEGDSVRAKYDVVMAYATKEKKVV